MSLGGLYLVDDTGICTFEKLKEELISQVKRDTLENLDDKDLVNRNMDLIVKVKDFNASEDFIIKELELFGYEITPLTQIKRNLINLRDYFNNLGFETLEKETIHIINEFEESIK